MLVRPRTVGCSTRCPAPPREPGALRWPSGRQLVRGQILLTRIIPPREVGDANRCLRFCPKCDIRVSTFAPCVGRSKETVRRC